jgi:glycerol-3-phosphate dehydrogenase
MALGPDRLVAGAPVLVGEVDWAVGVEAAATVEDVIYRRTLAAWFQPRHRVALGEAVADRMTTLLGWSSQRREEELCSLQQKFVAEFSFRARSSRLERDDD